MQEQAIENIQSVRAVRRKGARHVPRAFEIFAGDETYVFKAPDGKNAEQWVQCLQIAVARTRRSSRESVDGGVGSTGDEVPRWASLGRPVATSPIDRYRHAAQIMV